jgi:serine/threonine-protein kinase
MVKKLAGRYEVLDHIGQGAVADVFRAYDPSISRPLAIKVLREELRQHPQYAPRFLREAKAAGALSHPNIVTIYDVGERDGHPYIVMELLDGEPLDTVLQREAQLPAETVLHIGLQLADGLAYAHAQGVIHRDIKPSNIILGRDGRTIKIVDFGIARVSEGGEIELTDTLRTQHGQVLGTPRYMSPEQALGREIDGRSDLFSTGVILYELLTGRKAFPGASAATLALQITQQDPEPIAALAPDAPKGLQFIIEKLLAKRPEKRFADGASLAVALRRELGAQTAIGMEKRASARQLPLQFRLTLMIAAITAAALSISVATVLDRQYAAMQRVAVSSGATIASFVANNVALKAAENAVLAPADRDWAPVEAFVTAASGDPNVQQLTVVDAAGVVRAATDQTLIGRPYSAAASETLVQEDSSTRVTETAGSFRIVHPITYAGRAFGKVDVSVSRRELDAAARGSQALLLGLCVVVFGAVISVSFVMARLLTVPVRRLKAALAEAAEGRLDFRISHNRRDEFGELFDGFNQLCAALQERLEAGDIRAAAGPRLATAPAPSHEPDATQIVDAADATVIRAAG